MKLVFSSKAKDIIKKLDKHLAHRILDKMDWFFSKENPLLFAKELTNFTYATHRFRVGNYRIFGVFIKINNEFIISDIIIRGQAYKK